MKETKFIEQNKQKWKDFESLFESNNKDSKVLSKLFIQITDDLSYSRTFYANRSVRIYLNNLAQNIFHKIFNRNKKKQHAIKDYFIEELPSILYFHRKDILYSFLIVLLSVCIGVFTFWHDPAFANKILGDGYLSMTAENIAKNDPMAVYKSQNSLEMFLQIVGNNLYVDCITFFSGLFFMIGSVIILFKNGLMLAAFQFYFVKKHLFWESFLAVWLHGTLEISAMVICGAAGIILGKGIVFPGTYSRKQSFLSSAQRATKIFLAVLPVTFTAGIIESFLTRYTNAPNALRLGLILASLFFILGYFVYFPWIKKRNGTLRIPKEEKIIPENYRPIDRYAIRKISQLYLETFSLSRKHFGTIFKASLIITLICLPIIVKINKTYLSEYLININYLSFNLFTLIYGCVRNIDIFIQLNNGNYFAYFFPILIFIHVIISIFIFNKELNYFKKTDEILISNWIKLNIKQLVISLICCYIFFIIYALLPYKILFAIILIPVCFILIYSIFFTFNPESKNTISLKALSNGKIELLIGIIGILCIVLLVIALFNTACYWFIYEGIIMNFNNKIINENILFIGFNCFSFCVSIGISIYLISFFIGLFYISQKEKIMAEGLTNKLNSIGNNLRLYTFEK
jgi:uncharacterized membrane protein SpoIIM required for sporulation